MTKKEWIVLATLIGLIAAIVGFFQYVILPNETERLENLGYSYYLGKMIHALDEVEFESQKPANVELIKQVENSARLLTQTEERYSRMRELGAQPESLDAIVRDYIVQVNDADKNIQSVQLAMMSSLTKSLIYYSAIKNDAPARFSANKERIEQLFSKVHKALALVDALHEYIFPMVGEARIRSKYVDEQFGVELRVLAAEHLEAVYQSRK